MAEAVLRPSGSERVGQGRGRWLLLVAPLVAVLYMLTLGGAWVTTAVGGDCGLRARDAPGEPTGQIVDQVIPGSPADDADLRPGDAVVTVDGVPVSALGVGWSAYCTHRFGERIVLGVERRVSGAPGLANALDEVTLTLRWPFLRADVATLLVVSSLVGLLTVAVAVAVAMAQPGEPSARLLLIAGVSFATMLALDQWWPVEPWLPQLAGAGGVLFGLLAAIAVCHLFLAFPTPNPFLVRMRATAPASLQPVGGAMLLFYLVPPALMVADVAGWARPWLLPNLVGFAFLVGGLIALARSYVQPSSPLARAQLKWILVALAICVVSYFLGPIGGQLTGGRLQLIPDPLAVAAWALLPLAIGVAVLRYRLFDVDLVLRTGLIWLLLTGVLGGLYFAISFEVGELGSALLGPAAGMGAAASVIAALAIAGLAQPANQWLQGLVDQYIFRERSAVRRFVDEASDVLGRAQPPAKVARFLTQHAAERLGLAGAWVALGPGPAGSALSPPTPAAPDPIFARLRFAVEPVVLAREPVEMSGVAVLAADDGPLAAWHAAGARLLVPLRTGGPDSLDGGRAAAVARGEAGSARSDLIGFWALGARCAGRLADHDEMAALARIGRQAAVLFDYARLHEEQLQQALLRHDVARAREIQARLLPRTLPAGPAGLALAVRFRPAQGMSGDFYDVVPLGAAALNGATPHVADSAPALQVAVADVVGKGLGAALVMALARTTLRGIGQRPAGAPEPVAAAAGERLSGGAPAPEPASPSPATTMRLAGSLLHRDIGRGAGGSDFVACALAVIEPLAPDGGPTARGARLRLTNAAQVPPLLCRNGRAQELQPPGERLPLGVLPDPAYDELLIDLRPGDTVVFTSDGLPEAPARADRAAAARIGPSGAALTTAGAGEMFGFERLAESAAYWATRGGSAEAVAEGIWSEVSAWSGEAAGHDDMTLLVVRVPPAPLSATP